MRKARRTRAGDTTRRARLGASSKRGIVLIAPADSVDQPGREGWRFCRTVVGSAAEIDALRVAYALEEEAQVAAALDGEAVLIRSGAEEPDELEASPRRATRMKKPEPATSAESGLFGAEHRVRTGDLRLGKATLYQLS